MVYLLTTDDILGNAGLKDVTKGVRSVLAVRVVSLFVNRSAMFVEAVFKSTFGFSYVLFVTVVNVDNVFLSCSQCDD